MFKGKRTEELVQKYFYESQLPTMWCPGCGNGTVAMAMCRAVEELGLELDKVIHVAGIGCACVAHWYTRFTALQAAHGRALPCATGIKLASPDLTVLVTMGDGDCMAIGGNHFIHACRRNIDLVAIVYNNFNYGMTGGQVGPTTPRGVKTATSPFGNLERPFDVCEVAIASGATFVARGTVYHVTELISLIKKGIQHKGFGVIDVLVPCFTTFGRRNGFSTPSELWRWVADQTVPVQRWRQLDEREKVKKLPRGCLLERTLPEYTSEYYAFLNRVKEIGKEAD